MWALTTIRMAIVWHIIDEMYIVHGDTREDSYQSDTSPNSVMSNLYMVMKVFLAVNVVIAECVMVSSLSVPCPPYALLNFPVDKIWRCWIIYGRSWIVTGLPAIFLIAEIGMVLESGCSACS